MKSIVAKMIATNTHVVCDSHEIRLVVVTGDPDSILAGGSVTLHIDHADTQHRIEPGVEYNVTIERADGAEMDQRVPEPTSGSILPMSSIGGGKTPPELAADRIEQMKREETEPSKVLPPIGGGKTPAELAADRVDQMKREGASNVTSDANKPT